ncbi:MAG: energy-coupling factor ABC transporter ATP-binding protein [Candidatus Omnitrophota bacterium]
MEPQAIEIKNLNFAYPDGKRALCGVSLEVLQNECLGIVGPNGAGKSTLLLNLNGLLRGRGLLKVFGIELNDENLFLIRRKVGLVFQDPEDQLFMPTLEEDVGFGPKNLGLQGRQLEGRVAAALNAVGLNDQGQHLSYHLSLGEKKRAAIAAILAMQPEVFILDEPTSNLDPRSRRQIIRILNSLTTTKIVASHDLEFLLEVSSRVALLDKGEIVAQGRPRELFSDPALMEKHGLEVPFSLRCPP